jgi:hypothetical protein
MSSGAINVLLQEKLYKLSETFRPFCKLPTHLRGLLTAPEKEYITAITQMFSIDPIDLDTIAEELLQEWSLGMYMSDETLSSEHYISEFTERLNPRIEKAIEDLLPAFRSSQVSVSQDESMDEIRLSRSLSLVIAHSLGRRPAKVLSFSTAGMAESSIFSETFEAESISSVASNLVSMEGLRIRLKYFVSNDRD